MNNTCTDENIHSCSTCETNTDEGSMILNEYDEYICEYCEIERIADSLVLEE